MLYEARAFLGANHDTLHSAGGSAAAWLATSSRPHIAALFSTHRDRRPVLQRSRSTFSSVGQTFATDLGSLLTTLQNANTVHYVRRLEHNLQLQRNPNPNPHPHPNPHPTQVRCLKPNGQQRPRTFDPSFVRGRLRAAGTQAALAFARQLARSGEVR